MWIICMIYFIVIITILNLSSNISALEIWLCGYQLMIIFFKKYNSALNKNLILYKISTV